jgi:signal transduction histidine kinase
MRLILKGAQCLTGATSAILYLLHIDKAQFVPRVGNPRSVVGAPDFISVGVLEAEKAGSFIEGALRTGRIVPFRLHADGSFFTQLAIPIKRSAASSIGLMALQRPGSQPYSEEDYSILSVLASTIIPLIEKHSSLQLLEAIQQPINFHQSLNDYLQELLLLIAGASGMPMIAIRELDRDAGALRCIAKYGIPGEDLSALDLEPYDEFGPFKQVIDNKRPVAIVDTSTLNDKTVTDLTQRSGLDRVRSFVVSPILVGEADVVFGTLSFAAEFKFNYSHLEMAGFETIANAMGTSITNFRNSEAVGQLFQLEGEMAVGMTALEVAQAARHEARNVVDSITTELATLKTLVGKPKDNLGKINETVQRLFDNTQDIQGALDKIRNVSKPPKKELALVSLKRIINEAAALVSGKIAKERVTLRIDGRDVEIHAYPERLRHAFLNLFLNSLDAFSTRRKASNRNITIQLESRPSTADEVFTRYIDNATGIDVTKLTVHGAPGGAALTPFDIFTPGVTSKPSGSGHGLFLVRRILGEHKGSIDLSDYRNGVVFDIKLARHPTGSKK